MSEDRVRDQAWFWTPEWQAGEREATEEASYGDGEDFETGEAFIASF